ncbi:MAG: tandem-95 repeat protein [Myxococcales bacterium]|nr:tandem-95 repeat protein [Myxococcales bacterium]
MRSYLCVLSVAATLVACGDNLKGDQPPTVADKGVTTAEDTPVSFTLEATDPEGQPLAITAGTPAHGTITVAGATLTYTPAADYNGADGTTITVSDGDLTATATVTITVTPVNDAPIAVDDALAANEDVAAAIATAALLANDTDVDGDTLTITAVAAATNGTVDLAGDTITFTPPANFVGDATFEYTVSDGTDTDTATVTLAVGGANDPPVAVDDAATTPEDTELVIQPATLVANDTDADGQTLSLTAVGNPTNGTVTLIAGEVRFQPTADFNGAASFEYTVSDGVATDVGLVAVTVTPVNDGPVAGDDTATTAEDTAATLTAAALLANDTDVDGPALSITAVTGATNGTVALAGTTVTFTPAANFSGTAGFDYTVSDGTLTDTGHVTVTVTPVNDGPLAVDDAVTTAEDTAATIPAATLLANDTDVDGPALSVTAVTAATNGTVALAGTTVRFTPAANFSGTAGFDYTVSDGTLTDVGHVTVTVTAVNDAPVAVDDAVTTDEDTAATIPAATLLANDTDPDSTPTVTAVSAATNGTVALAGTTVTFTPTADFSGTAGFDYTISDGTLTDVGHVTVTVTPVNDAPVAVDDTATTAEDTAATIPAATLLANDTDPDSTPTVTAVSAATNGTVALAGTTVTFTPTADFSGTAGFDYTISDGALTDVGHVTVTVTAVNDAPVAVDDAVTTDEDTAATIPAATLLANDTDVDGTPTVTAVSAATSGTVALAGTTITFTPAANFSGTAGFDYTISDGALTDVGHVTVTVTAVNDAPVAGDDTGTTSQDVDATFTDAALLANDTDVDGPALSIAAVGNPINGTVARAAGVTTFTPDGGFVGVGSFEYTVSDGALTDIGRVVISIGNTNDPPVAVDDAAATDEDVPLVLAAATLSANDTDPDLDPLTVSAVSNATNGTVILALGTVTFTPAANFSGTAGFDYTVTDGFLTDVGHVTVTVNPINDAPVAVDDVAVTDEDLPVVLAAATLSGNDTDVDLDPLSVSAVSNATNGTVLLAVGTVTFTPDANFSGTAGFDYTISDGTLTDVGHVTVTVNPVDDLPVAVDDAAFTTEDLGVFVDVLVNDTGLGDGGITITATAGANGTTTAGAANVLYIPAPNFAGTDTFTYTITDGDGDAATATVTVTVDPVNDAPVAIATSATTDENVPVTITLAATDVDSPAVTFAIATAPTTGTLGAITPTGAFAATVVYTPTAGFDGSDGFTFTANDGALTSGAAAVTLTINNVAVCNDGLVEGAETCDDAGNTDGDGCSATCQTETGWSCAGAPSVCTEICGDTIVVGGEACDDGNGVDTDGCTTQCVAGAVCTSVIVGGDRFATDPATGHCYVSFDDEQLTFADAQLACAAVTGHLASITSAPEQALVESVQNTAQNPWIGLTDALVEGSFGWITGELLTFTNWEPGQPDGGEPEDCVNLFSTAVSPSGTAGTWNDTSCTFVGFTIGWICELDASPCGDGTLQAAVGEACDDGNTVSGDGCSSTCQIEAGAVCSGTAPTTCAKLVINEIDYDQAGTDTAEFVEIYNAGTAAADLSNVALVLFNGSSAAGLEYFFDSTVGASNAGKRIPPTAAAVPATSLAGGRPARHRPRHDRHACRGVPDQRHRYGRWLAAERRPGWARPDPDERDPDRDRRAQLRRFDDDRHHRCCDPHRRVHLRRDRGSRRHRHERWGGAVAVPPNAPDSRTTAATSCCGQ